MSKNKRFSGTSSNRYSLALYELAYESKSLDKVESNSYAFLNLITNNKEFYNFIKDPTIKKDVLEKVIKKISESSELDALFKNFLNFLISKRRLFFIKQILKSFVEICSEKRGELKAEIKSAKELSQDEINKITDDLSETFNSKIKLRYNCDKSLLGGLVVQVGSIMIDTSIKNKLQQIEYRMIEA